MAERAVAVLGAGAWGTALAVMLARGGRRVTLCARRPAQAELLLRARENAAYLPGVELPPALAVTAQWRAAAAAAELAVIAIPSRFARAALTAVASALPPGTIVISATKGIEEGSLNTMTEMIAEVAPRVIHPAVLSGPGFAAELARDQPAALVAASRDEQIARQVQELFASRSLRIYRSLDVAGVELGGAVKNVIAIAAGLSDGLELGASARAALITRGLAEIMRLGGAMGARRETLAGLSGLGDLVLTCTGDLSRNRRLGLRLARGESDLAQAQPTAPGQPVAEGVANARSLTMLAQRHGVEMPIVEAVYRCLYEGLAPRAMVDGLLSRELKAEF